MCIWARPWRIPVFPSRPRSTEVRPTVGAAERSTCRSRWARGDLRGPAVTLGDHRGGEEVPKLEQSRLRLVASGRTFLPAPTSLASPGQRLWKATFCQPPWKSEGPPSSDKGNLERKGKIVKRGAKGHKGKKKKIQKNHPTPPPNKNEDQDRC